MIEKFERIRIRDMRLEAEAGKKGFHKLLKKSLDKYYAADRQICLLNHISRVSMEEKLMRENGIDPCSAVKFDKLIATMARR